ncbi:hypothetical protein [Escherichia phage UB]|uniref:Uncharacterized protein n=1 Tax=Escherichia phage UB TaxID=2268588 RepID=A0A2Z5H909_9CAUD|nr:hypothetical protein [Escherichia phage UB]
MYSVLKLFTISRNVGYFSFFISLFSSNDSKTISLSLIINDSSFSLKTRISGLSSLQFLEALDVNLEFKNDLRNSSYFEMSLTLIYPTLIKKMDGDAFKRRC